MNKKDYVFNLNWDDIKKNSIKVGCLAQINEEFYFVISTEKNAETAYQNGFIGIPGFKPGEIYKSQELFDFFKNRVLDKDSADPCEELSETKGISSIDSFSLEPVPDSLLKRQIEILLEAYEKQEELKGLRAKEDGERDA